MRFIKSKAAVQLQWQSSNVPMTPPFSTPSKASYFFSGFHSATTSPFFGKLRICSPSGFAGPQPQHALFGAYFSWSDLSFILEISQAAQPRFFCQRVEDNAFHLRIRKGGSASTKTMPSPIAEGAVFFRFATQSVGLSPACRLVWIGTQFMPN